jgi:hypothetical protein
MQRIEFSELTNRLRRNLMGAAFIIVAIAGFNIRVGKVLASGMELENLTTEVVLIALLAFLIYHVVAFGIHAFEEYRLWELKPADKFLETEGPMTEARKIVGRINAILNEVGQREDFTKEDFEKLEEALEGALVYAKHFQSFPVITRVRFWTLDIGTALVITIVAILFSVSVLPPGLISDWLL